MPTEVFGAKFEIDVTNLKAGITEANRYVRLAESEFKAASAGMDDWRKSEEGLLAKQSQLTTTLQAQRAKVDALQQAYNETADSMGENSAEAVNLKIRLNKAQAEYNKSEKEMRDVNTALDEMRTESKQAGIAISKAGQEAEDAGKGFGSLGDKAKTAAGALAASLAAIPASILGLSKSTEEYRGDISVLENAFTSQGHSVETAHKVYDDFMGLLGETDQSVEAANNLARLTTNQNELAQWTNISAGAFSLFGDALPIENLSEAAQETAHTGQVVGGLADALNWSTATNKEFSAAMEGHGAAQRAFNQALADGATKEDAFNAALEACSSEQERSQLITATLNGLYGEAGEKYRENNADLIEARKAQEDFNQATSAAGDAVRPLATALQEIGTSIINAVIPYLQQFSTWFQANLPNMRAALQPLADAFKWLIDNLPTIAPIVAGIATAFLAFKGITAIVNGINGAMTAWKVATDGMRISQMLLNAVMNANPLILVASLVAGLAVALVALWNTNDGFRNAVISAWNGIRDTATSVFSSIGSFISGVWNGIQTAAGTVWNGIKSVISGVMNGIKGAVTTAMNGVKTAFNVVNSIKNTVTSVFNAIKSAISDPVNKAKNVVKNAIDKIKGFFDFKITFPNVPLPHFTIKPSGWEIGDLMKGTIPTLGVDFYAKGGILKRPTIFGMNGNNMMVGGEAGAEAVAPISELMGYVRAAVHDEMERPTVVFNQNNYSPKALSAYDTYRQGLKVAQALASEV